MKKFSQYINSQEDCGCDQVQEAKGFMTGLKQTVLPDIQPGEYGAAAGGAVGGILKSIGGSAASSLLGKFGQTILPAAKAGAETGVEGERKVKTAGDRCDDEAADIEFDLSQLEQEASDRKKKAKSGASAGVDITGLNIERRIDKKRREFELKKQMCAKLKKAETSKDLSRLEREEQADRAKEGQKRLQRRERKDHLMNILRNRTP